MADAITGLLQFAPGIAKLVVDLASTSDAAKRNAQLIEFQHAIIGLNSLIASVQQENATLLRQKNDAEAELKRMKNWDTQKARYKLVAPFAGCMVYALQKSVSAGEPAHYLCAACFENGQRSILQGREGHPRKEGGRVAGGYFCTVCESEAFTGYVNAPAPQYFEDVIPET